MMSQAEALTEAQRRWGSIATVRAFRNGSYYVGLYVPTSEDVWNWKGTGKSWEEAFANADRS